MTEQNHNFEIETALLHFQSALDGAIINRYAGDWADPSQNLTTRKAEQKIKVNYVFGPKQRIIADLEGKTDTVKFPIVAICPTGMGRDDARIKNKNDTVKFRLKDGNYGNFNVVPWNINVSVTIMTRFQEDMTQIISNFAVVSNPYIIFSWKEPKTGLDVRAEVSWDGQMSMEYPGASNDLPPNAPFRVMGTANFVIKTFLYRTEIENTAKICKIDTDVIATKNFYCNYDSLVANTNENGRDEYETLGKPQLRYVDKYYFKEGDSRNVLIQGDGFALTDAIYLSGSSDLIYPLKDYNIDGFKFRGHLVDSFEILNAQNLSFTMPPPSSFGFVDIIVVNKCGIGQLTKDVNRCSRVENPYKPTSPDYNTWRVQQFPYLNGLVVSSNLNDSVFVNCDDYILVYTDPNTEQSWLSACEASILIKPIHCDTDSISLDEVITYLNTTVLATNSSLWDEAYTNLVENSALYLEKGTIIDLTDVESNSSNWDEAYNNLINNSSLYLTDTNDGDLSVNNFVYSNSADILDINSVVQNNSALWILSGLGEENDPVFSVWSQTYSANYESTFNTVLDNSSNWNYQGTSLNFEIDGGGREITTGEKSVIFVPFDVNLTGWRLLASQSGSIVIDVLTASYDNYPSTNSIAGTEKPTLVSAIKSQNLSLSSWPLIIEKDTIITFNVESVEDVEKIKLNIIGNKL